MPNASSSNVLTALSTTATSGRGTTGIGSQQDVNPEECDKEKMEAIKNKQKQAVAFDMFADDDDYETVNYIYKLFV